VPLFISEASLFAHENAAEVISGNCLCPHALGQCRLLKNCINVHQRASLFLGVADRKQYLALCLRFPCCGCVDVTARGV
jgi:hypothetical protein